ncbi:MAG: proline racemase family protein [Defluviitaleaceae bacterium]|nr:proline racemase family protein [Defluviitaleaceae bacterium]
MRFSKMISTIDTHTMGEPTRIVTGVPRLRGDTMVEKKQFLIEHMDYVRTMLMHEPRGHRDMFGAIIAQPTTLGADLGVIFMDGGGYLNMCGHGTIGTVTAAIETGMLEAIEPYTEVLMDTPAGPVKARAHVAEGQVERVSFINVPSFSHRIDAEVDVPKIGKIVVDIAFGGSFFALVRAKDVGLKIIPENAREFSWRGLLIRKAVNEQISVEHPMMPRIKSVDLVKFYDEPESPEANARNVVVFGDGQVDRSPCGTGTCAKLATLYAKGMIKEGEEFVYESILGTHFTGKIVGKMKMEGIEAVIPEITGSAYITGFNKLVIDDRDPVKYGFTL